MMMTYDEVMARMVQLESELRELRRLRRQMYNQGDIHRILEHTAQQLEVSVTDMRSPVRHRYVTDARAIFAMRAFAAGYSYQHIGKVLGKDRSSIYSMVERARAYMSNNDDFKAKFNSIS